jgi:hypothetical protein
MPSRTRKPRLSLVCPSPIYLLALVVVVVSAAAIADETPSWNAQTLAKENTLRFLTVGPQEGEHWSKVWVVAVDDQLYVRLGPRGRTIPEEHDRPLREGEDRGTGVRSRARRTSA